MPIDANTTMKGIDIQGSVRLQGNQNGGRLVDLRVLFHHSQARRVGFCCVFLERLDTLHRRWSVPGGGGVAAVCERSGGRTCIYTI